MIWILDQQYQNLVPATQFHETGNLPLPQNEGLFSRNRNVQRPAEPIHDRM